MTRKRHLLLDHRVVFETLDGDYFTTKIINAAKITKSRIYRQDFWIVVTKVGSYDRLSSGPPIGL